MAAEKLIPVTLELGGKSPNIIFADADLQDAIPVTVRAFTINTGQACSAGTRLIVNRGIHDEVVAALAEAVQVLPRPSNWARSSRRRSMPRCAHTSTWPKQRAPCW